MEARNPNIVRTLEEKGPVIKNKHSGMPNMKSEMKKYNLLAPEIYEERGSFKVIFRNSNGNIKNHYGDTQSDTQIIKLSDINQKILEYCIEPKISQEIREFLQISSKRYVAYNIIKPLIKLELLDYTNKNRVNARNQKYVTTKKIR